VPESDPAAGAREVDVAATPAPANGARTEYSQNEGSDHRRNEQRSENQHHGTVRHAGVIPCAKRLSHNERLCRPAALGSTNVIV